MRASTIIIYILAFFLTISMALAYDNSTLLQYYTMGDGYNVSSVYDTHTGATNKIRSGYTVVTGLQGNAMYWNYDYADNPFAAGVLGNDTGVNFDSASWSINFWINQSGNHLVYNYFTPYDYNFAHQGRGFRWSGNTSHITSSALVRYCSGSTCTDASGGIAGGNYFDYHMITITYDLFSNNMSFYFDGVYVWADVWDITSDIDTIVLNAYETSIDEYSIWSSVLNTTDMAILYNSGEGLNYAETMAGASGSNYSENTSEFNYNYCISDTQLCSIYNMSDSTCLGTITNCSYACESGICVDETFMIDNNTFSVNQCIQNLGASNDYLCNNTFFYDDAFYCDIDDIINCSYGCMQTIYDTVDETYYFTSYGKSCEILQSEIPFGYKLLCSPFWIINLYEECLENSYITIPIVACSDSDIWDILSTIGNHSTYTEGACMNQSCQDKCSPVNQYGCTNTYYQTKCVIDVNTGCTILNVTQLCPTQYYDGVYNKICSGGSCIDNPAYLALLETDGVTNTTSSDTYLSSLGGITETQKYLVFILLLLAFFLVPFISGFSAGFPDIGFILGVIFAIMITIFASIPAFPLVGGFIPIYVPIVIGIIAAGIVAIYIRNKVMTTGE